MTTVTIEEAQATLPVLISSLKPGEEAVIGDNGLSVARLIKLPHQRALGGGIGKLRIVEDDDERLQAFSVRFIGGITRPPSWSSCATILAT
jgi:antitoxin (DNA-binding transcriptional repressor) of toxin-antitoxin stability system